MDYFAIKTLLMVLLYFIILFNFSSSYNITYSGTFLMKANLSLEEAKYVSARYGFTFYKQVLDEYFVLKAPDVVSGLGVKSKRKSLDRLKLHPQVTYLEQEEYVHRVLRSTLTITDPQWTNMWHLQPIKTPNMNVYTAWTKGFTGSGVMVGLVDDGIDTTHADLSSNYRSYLSYDYINDDSDPSHSFMDEGHGTMCAGVLAAVKNNQCVLGVAYDAKFAAIKLLEYDRRNTASDEALSLSHRLDSIDIYSNSWGPKDDGDVFGGASDVVIDALIKGVTQGRNGKGVIYTFAAGNGGDDDDCNCDGYANSIYTIAINSVAPTLSPAFYAEHCTAVMASTYSGDSQTHDPLIVTTYLYDGCDNEFQGTSASCPMASGIFALALQANPDLTWRDVQHLIVETSTTTHLRNGDFIINGKGKSVSRYFGFGLLNAESMVSRAQIWKTVPDQIYTSWTTTPSRSSRFGSTLRSSFKNSTNIKFIEHVTVKITFKSEKRGDVEFYLTSPSGTESKLLHRRPKDTRYMSRYFTWTFMTVHSWGEDPSGRWTLRMESATGYSSGYNGGACLKNNMCSENGTGCSTGIDLCEHCSNGSHVINGKCVSTLKTSPTTPTTSSTDFNVEMIIGGVVGGVIGLVVLMCTIRACRQIKAPIKRQQKNKMADRGVVISTVFGNTRYPGPPVEPPSYYN